MKLVYHQRFKKRFKRSIESSTSLKRRFQKRLELFLANSKDPILRDHVLTGDLEGYRSFSITGDIRVIYYLDGDSIHLYDIGTHNQVY